MGFKREVINGATPLDIKKLNDNFANIFLKLFGNIDFTDLASDVTGNINSKLSLMATGQVNTTGNNLNHDIQLGDEFKGKNFKVILSIDTALPEGTDKTIYGMYTQVLNLNTTNATFTVHGQLITPDFSQQGGLIINWIAIA